MTITELVKRCHQQAKDKGFVAAGPSVGDLLMLMVTELGEAFEEYRKGLHPSEEYTSGPSGKPEGVPSELADVVIRIADFCGRYEIDLERVIAEKLDYNQGREHLHGKKF